MEVVINAQHRNKHGGGGRRARLPGKQGESERDGERETHYAYYPQIASLMQIAVDSHRSRDSYHLVQTSRVQSRRPTNNRRRNVRRVERTDGVDSMAEDGAPFGLFRMRTFSLFSSPTGEMTFPMRPRAAKEIPVDRAAR